MRVFIYIITIISLSSCKYYNFTGGSTGSATSFQVNFFRNDAPLVEPGLDRDFTLALQDLINNQTNLSLTDRNGDLVYEGEIVDYTITPMTATAQQTAAQNRLTIAVNVRFTNNTEENKDFERRFSFYYDYPGAAQLSAVKDAAHAEIFERITQDIFNASLADW
ncbi:MAG: LptE family protein [Capnocytophaga sp.]|nr:LptE family protein [Capnocytophaga sp.]